MRNLEKTAAASCFGGEVQTFKHASTSTSCDMQFSVFVPPQAAAKRVPVLYYLSGLTCTDQNFITKAGAQRRSAELGVMLVAPDTSPRGCELPGEDENWDFGTGAGFYVDATVPEWSGHYKMYSYVVDELPALIESNFSVTDQRSIFGHSMGGHGALVVGLRNRERYRSISAFSPICAPTQCPWGHKAFGGYLGKDESTWKNYDATELVKQYQHPQSILIDQGEQDSFLKEQLLPEKFAEAAAEAGQSVEIRMQPGYDHSYYFIQTFIDDHISFHAGHLAL